MFTEDHPGRSGCGGDGPDPAPWSYAHIIKDTAAVDPW